MSAIARICPSIIRRVVSNGRLSAPQVAAASNSRLAFSSVAPSKEFEHCVCASDAQAMVATANAAMIATHERRRRVMSSTVRIFSRQTQKLYSFVARPETRVTHKHHPTKPDVELNTSGCCGDLLDVLPFAPDFLTELPGRQSRAGDLNLKCEGCRWPELLGHVSL